MPCKLNNRILEYMEQIETGAIRACEEQHQLVKYVRYIFNTEDIWVNEEQLENYLSQTKYFPYERLFPWEVFVFALHNCVYRWDNRPRWPDLFMLIGRGAGKDGYIAYESFCLIGPYNGIGHYDADICANTEDQAKAPFTDVWEILESPIWSKKLERFFRWNLEEIECKKTKSKIKFRANNPKGRDGMRSGIVIFNEIHQYQDYKNINVFTTGLGKKPHPRRTYATTNGDVRDGPLDQMLATSMLILKREIPDNGMLPFVCRLNEKEQVHDPENWQMANPSLPYREDLRIEIEKEYIDWKAHPNEFTDFMTKRMNFPQQDTELAAVPWENIEAATRERPDTTGFDAIIGIDFVKTSDFATVGALTKIDGEYVWESNSWFCTHSCDKERLHVPWQQWAEEGKLTVCDDVEIDLDSVEEYILDLCEKYNVIGVVLDTFRYQLVKRVLENCGFTAGKGGNIFLIRPSEIIKVVPIVDQIFLRNKIAWGIYEPLMRWFTNNTKKAPASAAAKQRAGSDANGNYKYEKIEPKSRKTDGFMALVAAMTQESLLSDEIVDDEGLWMPVITG